MDHMVRITATDLGRRVSVRRRTPSGSATDVVGDLTTWTDSLLTVRDREDVEHEISRCDVLAGRVVQSRPAPPRAVELERVAASGWPAVEVEPLGDWLLRASGGFTGRANSALAVGSPGLPADAAADIVRSWYTARDLPPRAATVMASAEDDAFAALGWTPSPSVLVKTATIAGVVTEAGEVPHQGDVTVHPTPTDAWLTRYTARGQVTALGKQVLTGGPVVGFAQLGDEPTGIGRGVIVGDWLGISAIEVAPHARRRGLAIAITQALLIWGTTHGATHAYLQVQADNHSARTLYERLGFRTQHRYHYRLAP